MKCILHFAQNSPGHDLILPAKRKYQRGAEVMTLASPASESSVLATLTVHFSSLKKYVFLRTSLSSLCSTVSIAVCVLESCLVSDNRAADTICSAFD